MTFHVGTAVCASPVNLFDIGDVTCVEQVMARSERTIVLLDGENRSLSSHLFPLTVDERRQAFGLLFPKEIASGRLSLVSLESNPYRLPARRKAARAAIANTVRAQGGAMSRSAVKIIATGGDGDAVRDLFPSFETIEFQLGLQPEMPPSLFDDSSYDCPPQIEAWLDDWKNGTGFARLCDEYRFCVDEKAEWASAPFPPVFVTSDVVIVCGRKILLIRRANHPGKGLLALPGGYINRWETILGMALREANEETAIDIRKVRKFLRRVFVADDPNRDPRGHIITHAHLFRLPFDEPPHVEARDDASDAFWADLDKLSPKDFALDHWFLIRELIGRDLMD